MTGGRKAELRALDELTLLAIGDPGKGLKAPLAALLVPPCRWVCEDSLDTCGSMADVDDCCMGLNPTGVLGLIRVGCRALPLSDPSCPLLVRLPTLVARPPRARVASGPEAEKDPSEDAGMVGLIPKPEAPDESRWLEFALLLLMTVAGPSVLEEVVTASRPALDKESSPLLED